MSTDAFALFAIYESRMTAHRDRLLDGPFGRFVMGGAPDARAIHMFLAHYCSLGVGVTAPVRGWIRRAGEATESLGMRDLGTALTKHASRKAGHEQMMIADTRALCRRWRDSFSAPLDERTLLNAPLPAGARAYIDLHEQVIAGPAPYGQIAIEYEIERLSLDIGPKFIGRAVKVLGVDILDCVSFITNHAALDVSHTEFSATLITRFLGDYPEALPILVDTGARALRAYGAFLDDCVDLATRRLAKAA